MRKFLAGIVLVVMTIFISYASAAFANDNTASSLKPEIEVLWENSTSGKSPDDPIIVGDQLDIIVKVHNVESLYGYGVNIFYDKAALSPVHPESPFDETVRETIFSDRLTELSTESPVNKETVFDADDAAYGNLAGRTASVYMDFLSGEVQGVDLQEGVIAKGTFTSKGALEYTPRVSDRLQDVGNPEEAPINVVIQLANDTMVEEGSALNTQAISYNVLTAETLNVLTEPPSPEKNVNGTITQNEEVKSGVWISAHTTDGSDLWYDAKTDENGAFSFSLDDGTYQIDGVWLEDQQKWYELERQFDVVNGVTEDIVIDLSSNSSGNITGSLVNGTTPVPNTGFSIHTTSESPVWYDITSDESGAFTVELPDGEYQIDGVWLQSDQTWYPLEQRFTVESGAIVGSSELVVDLSSIPPPGSLSISIFKGAAPIQDTWVSTHSIGDNEVWYDAQTDENGVLTLDLPDGNYQIDGVWLEGESKWYPLEITFTVSNGHIGDSLELTIDILSPEYKITGTVMKGTTPVSEVWVSAHTIDGSDLWFDALTNEQGEFELALTRGEYQIDGIWIEGEQKWYQLDKRFVVEGKASMQIDLNKMPTGPVKGSLVKGSEALSNVVFSFHKMNDNEEAWYDVQTDTEGAFEIPALPDGLYKVDGIWLDSEQKWYQLDRQFTIENGKLMNGTELTIDIETEPMPPTGSVEGQVKNGTESVSDLTFSFHSTAATETWYDAKTDSAGFFKLDLPDGEYIIEGIWLETEQKWVELKTAFTVKDGVSVGELIIDLENPQGPLPVVTGQIMKDSLPVQNVWVSIHTAVDTSQWYDAFTNEKGEFTFQGLPDDTYQIDGIWVEEEANWYVLNQQFKVEDGVLVDLESLLIDLNN